MGSDRPGDVARLLNKLTRSREYILAAALYPTTVRSTGIAWALGVGRAGTMLGPIVGSLMLVAKMAPAGILYSTAIPAAIAAAAILLLGRRMRPKPTAAVAVMPTKIT